MCAVYYTNNLGGVVELLNHLAKEIWQWCRDRKIHISASYVPGKESIVADFRSQNFKDNTEWSLNSTVFQMIVETFAMLDAFKLDSRKICFMAARP